MSEWFIARDGSQEGPMTAAQVGALLANGEVKANTTFAWKEGMAEWKSLAEAGLLKEISMGSPPPATGGLQTPSAVANPQPTPTPAQVAPQSTGALNPYAAPSSTITATRDSAQTLEYPGIGRLAYFLWQMGISVIAYGLLFAVILGSSGSGGSEGIAGLFILVVMIVGVAAVFLGVKRVQNLGMSGWAILWSLVPIISVWISWRMFACPAGYHDHKQLDTAGKVLTGILIVFFILAVVANVFVAVSGVETSRTP
ncbi:GYF domain-containing protein [Haloferula sp.]|uniref:GYF domain-containing protein n=1 Tax=Haloferula sp. TaxID=2497595 RepID=UPI003C764B3A